MAMGQLMWKLASSVLISYACRVRACLNKSAHNGHLQDRTALARRLGSVHLDARLGARVDHQAGDAAAILQRAPAQQHLVDRHRHRGHAACTRTPCTHAAAKVCHTC